MSYTTINVKSMDPPNSSQDVVGGLPVETNTKSMDPPNSRQGVAGLPKVETNTNLYYNSSDEEGTDNNGVVIPPAENTTVVLPIDDTADMYDEIGDNNDDLAANKELFANLPSFTDVARSLHTSNSVKKTIIRRRSKRDLSKTLKNAATNTVDPGEGGVSIENLNKQKDKEESEMEIIRSMGAPMGQRKSIRKMNQERHKTNDLRQRLSCWKLFKLKTAMTWKLFKDKIGEAFLSLQLWRGSLKEIEGKFGNGVLSYFVFLKSLFILNILLFVVELFLIVPQALINYDVLKDPLNATAPRVTPDYVTGHNASQLLLDFFTGTGWINTTIMYYSNYYGKIVVGQDKLSYNMPLAYMMVGGAYMILSFLIMVRNFSERFTESVLESGDSSSYCNKVFASWDYCITNDNAAELKKNVIFQDFVADLEEEKRMEQISRRTTFEKFKVYLIRLVINIIIIGLLVASVFAIVHTVRISTQESGPVGMENAKTFFKRWASSLTITALNLFLPTLFEILTNLEQWSPQMSIVFTLWRAVLLKLASVIVLMVTLYEKYSTHTCNDCWENHIAAQMFNLIIVDFIVICLVTIFVETSRKYASRYFKCHVFGFILGDKIGRPEFQIPKNILDLVYGQSLIWIGTFFAPVLPVLGILKLFIIFYVKKISLLFNCKSSSKSFQGARSNYFITLLLLLTFLMCTVAIGVAVAQLRTSKCGPFSNTECTKKYMIDIVEKTISTWPSWINGIITFLKTAVFLFPLFIIIFLLLYYYHAMTSAHEKMIELLHAQLKIEGRDKRFLMNRLVEVNKKMTKK